MKSQEALTEHSSVMQNKRAKLRKRYRLRQLQQREVDLQTAEKALCIIRQPALLKTLTFISCERKLLPPQVSSGVAAFKAWFTDLQGTLRLRDSAVSELFSQQN